MWASHSGVTRFVAAGPLADDGLGGETVVVDVGQEVADLQEQLAREQREATTDASLAHADAVNDAADPATVSEPVVEGTVAHLSAVPEEAPPADDDAPAAPLDRAQLWDAVEALAAERGKTTTQLLARHTLATRTNPEDMSAEQLQAFLNAQRGL